MVEMLTTLILALTSIIVIIVYIIMNTKATIEEMDRLKAETSESNLGWKALYWSFTALMITSASIVIYSIISEIINIKNI